MHEPLMEAAAPAAVAWLKVLRRGPGTRVRLVCFPYAGVGVNAYREWTRLLDPRVEIVAVRLPGREARRDEPSAQHMDEIVGPVMHDLQRLPAMPTAFFGHCLGAIVAFDLALRLQDRPGWQPQDVVVSGRQPPHVLKGGEFHKLPDETLLEQIRRMNGTPEAILADPEMRSMMLPILRSDYRVTETYLVPPGGRLRCPLTICASSDDVGAPVPQMARWAELTDVPHQVWHFQGDHFYLKSQVALLLERLGRWLLRDQAA
ncbi:MAG TPA: thioesterase domain-containing protein [Burkholderiaceae bacterium]|nr:thioesterase domain-containing protein [Burkholderiaceae bacterium]